MFLLYKNKLYNFEGLREKYNKIYNNYYPLLYVVQKNQVIDSKIKCLIEKDLKNSLFYP